MYLVSKGIKKSTVYVIQTKNKIIERKKTVRRKKWSVSRKSERGWEIKSLYRGKRGILKRGRSVRENEGTIETEWKREREGGETQWGNNI